jgi:hypothetical protein
MCLHYTAAGQRENIWFSYYKNSGIFTPAVMIIRASTFSSRLFQDIYVYYERKLVTLKPPIIAVNFSKF